MFKSGQKEINQDIKEAEAKDKETKKDNKITRFFKLDATRKVTYIAVLVALAIVTKMFSIPVGQSQKASLLYLPCFLAGSLFGPSIGFMTGVIADITGTFINVMGGSAIPNPIITLGNGLLGFIMGVAFKLPLKNTGVKLTLGTLASLIICTFGLNTIGLAVMYADPSVGFFQNYINQLVIYNFPLSRIFFQPLVMIANVLLFLPIYIATKKYLFNNLPQKSTE